MYQRTLVLILSSLFLLNSFSAYSKTIESYSSIPTALPAHYDLKQAVTGLDINWNPGLLSHFLEDKNGFIFNFPGKKSTHIAFPRILNSKTPITLKTGSENIQQYLVSPNTYRAQIIGRYLVYRGNRNAILYRYDADKRQLREFVYLSEASALPEKGEVIKWRFEGADLKPRDDGSVLLKKTVDFTTEVHQISDNTMTARIGRFIDKQYGKQSTQTPVEHTLFVIPSPEYVTKSGEIRKQGIHYRIENSNLTLMMTSRAPLAYPLWLDPSLSADTDSNVILNGQGAGDNMGFPVASAGDFNGDGFDDVIVGAHLDDNNGQNDAGSAFIFFGGQTGTIDNPDANADVVLHGNGAGDHFGLSVASAGDFNGDGLGDVIVGARNDDNNGIPNSGSAFIFFGGQTGTINDPDINADVVLNGQSANDDFGLSVASAGDVNGDGLDDVIVGAPEDDNNGLADSGSAFIYFGGQTGTINDPDTNADVVLNGQGADDRFGFSVASAGDFNGDGFNDIIIGALLDDNNGLASSGSAFIFFGNLSGTINNPDTNANVVFNGEGAVDELGRSVASAGDFNGDGLSDVIISAPLDDNNGLNGSGSAYIFFGGQTGTINNPSTNANVVLNGQGAGDHFGNIVSSAGDYNKDGLDDVIVGVPRDDNNGVESGSAFIYFGGQTGTINNPDTNADVRWYGQNAGDQFGASVAFAGDFNGDGIDDVISGAFLDDNNGAADSGSAFIRFGQINLNADEHNIIIDGQSGGDSLGFSVSSAGDFNGDGFDDVIIGATSADDGGIFSFGRAYIFFGQGTSTQLSLRPNSDADVIINGNGGLFGLPVSGVGDFNGDGLDDVIIGAHLEGTGKAYVIFGRNPVNQLELDSQTDADVIVNGTGNLGNSVSSAGDFNGDGLKDIILGAADNANPGGGPGKAYIFFGRNPPNQLILNAGTNANVTLNGQNNEDNFGDSVASAGDFNGDGLDDVIVGAPSDDNNGEEFSGSAFIFFGQSPAGPITLGADSNANVVLDGQDTRDFFGDAVSSAGDFNGDGLDDVIVGAAGHAFIFFGQNPPSQLKLRSEIDANLVINGNSNQVRLGMSVSSAGDFNGDGFGDVLVGSRGQENGGRSKGRVDLYFGQNLSTQLILNDEGDANLTINGQILSTNFAESLGSAGDFNGDGTPDIIVGARENGNNGEIRSGSAFIFFSPFKKEPNVHNDFNGDLGSDLLFVQNTGVIANGRLNNSILQTFDGILQVDPALGWTVNATGDFNGDNKSDLLLYNTITGEIRMVWLNGANILNDTVLLTLDPAFGLVPQGVGDFNGNGRDEIVVFDPLSGFVAMIFMDDAGLFSSFEAVTAVDVANDWTLHQTGDYNGDGRTDLLQYNTLSGEALYLEMNGSTVDSFAGLFSLPIADGWSLEETGNFDGNRSTDLLFTNGSGLIAVLTFQKGAFQSFFVPGSVPANSEIVNAGQYDSDNKEDFLIRNTVTGDIQTAIQDGSQITSFNNILTLDPATGWVPHSGKP